MTLSDLFWLALLGLGIFHWLKSREMKDYVLQACKKYCEATTLQLLDEGLVLRAIWFKRDEKGKLRLWRRYEFEFTSTGDERYTGKAITLGKRILRIETGVHRMELH
ncbi:MAG: DUF3301 domain-containing protein [Hahellaceae bacterium]|nr:DUF3301 domain-containing protein [Hahellaceae bacterium]MCP5168257.1 DUF3301 domain-containing protein [Hahellaceae bacterium]